MIYCIWYPSGGFGHFINGVISLHGKRFCRPNKKMVFGPTGDSHGLDLVAPKYFQDPQQYAFEFEYQKNYTVLIDNGIGNEGRKFQSVFADSRVIKICYNDKTWPIVAKTMIDKAMKSDIQDQLPLDANAWLCDQDWAKREKYFLFLRDHDFRYAWRPESDVDHLMIDDLLDYDRFVNRLAEIDIQMEDFESLWKQWYQANDAYISPTVIAQSVIDSMKTKQNRSLSDLDNLWIQAVVCYFIWLEFGKEIPHNDYADFFTDTNEILRWINS